VVFLDGVSGYEQEGSRFKSCQPRQKI